MNNKKKFEELLEELRPTDPKHIYNDKALDPKGIDYKRFIKLRYDVINNNSIANFYTVKGWYLLWNLMVKAHMNQRVETTINMIAKKTNLKTAEINKLLIDLHKQGVIAMNKVEEIKANTPLDIIIFYADDHGYSSYSDSFEEKKNGYRAIPNDFLEVVLPTLTPEEWAIYCVLVVRYSYFTVTEQKNDGTGEEFYKYSINQYAFPTERQIGEHIGKDKMTVGRYLKKLENNKYNLIKVHNNNRIEMYIDDTKRARPKWSNNIYYITLLERVEYNWYHLVKVTNDGAVEKEINKRGYKNIVKSKAYKMIKDRHFVLYEYGNEIETFKECLNIKGDQTIESYKKIKKKLDSYTS